MSNFRSSIMEYSSTEDTSYLTHSIFRWYGKLVPPLVKDILELYTSQGDNVIANFNGSGTIALECLTHNINVSGCDINPLAILVSKVKTTLLKKVDIQEEVNSIIFDAKKIELCENDFMNLYDPYKWYKKDAVEKLIKLKKAISKIEDDDFRDFFLVCLASIVRECSNIDSRCVNHIVVDKNRGEPDVYAVFKKETIDNYYAVMKLSEINNDVKPKFYLNDARNLSFADDNSVDLVFSHPPYLNAINYYNIHRLCTDLLGYNYEEIRGMDFSAKNYVTFLNFMKETFVEARRVLKPGKRLVVVIGDVRYKGNILPLGSDFIQLLRETEFDIEDIFIWVLNKKAGMNVARRGNHIDHNFVIVAKKKEL